MIIDMNEFEFENGAFHEYNDSDEDTEDASETESMKFMNDDLSYDAMDDFDSNYEIKEQIYRDKLAQLKDQLAQLENGSHPDYLNGLEDIQKAYKERLFFIQCYYEIEQSLIDSDFKIEEQAAIQEFNDRRIELKESLISDLEEKRKIIDTDSNFELTNDTVEPKPIPTRKLRRRPNDPTPMPDRRRRTSPAQINLLLDENDINEDLKLITKILNAASKASGGRSSSSAKNSMDYESFHSNDVRIEDGKLFYDKKWFHRGQNILLESFDGTKSNAMIIQIGSNELWVRKSNETSKSKVSLADLHSKKYSIQRRS